MSAADFYNVDDPARWGRAELPEALRETAAWLARAAVPDGPFLELGCGRGALAELSPRYAGVDLSLPALARGRGRRFCADMERLPVSDESMAFLFSWAALEHVPHPERVLAEIERVLRPGGVALLAPAWHCRPWAAEGLEFRPYRALRPGQRVRKRLIPLRNALWWRAMFEMPRRLVREWRLRRGTGRDHGCGLAAARLARRRDPRRARAREDRGLGAHHRFGRQRRRLRALGFCPRCLTQGP